MKADAGVAMQKVLSRIFRAKNGENNVLESGLRA